MIIARKRTLLEKTRIIIKFYLEGIANSRKLGEYVGLSHTKIQGFIRLFSGSPYTFEELLQLDDEALAVVVYPQDAKPSPKKELPDYEAVEKALCKGKKNGVTRTLLWMEYIEQNPDGYGLSQYNEYYKRFRKQNKKSSMHQNKIPGERLHKDYSGLKMY